MQDFVWWSGLTTKDAEKGILLNKSKLHQETIENTIYWFLDTSTHKEESNIYLLPNYDEYIVGYKDRKLIFDNQHYTKLDARANPLFQYTIILDGKVIGTWKREFKKNSIALSTKIFEPLGKTEEELMEHAIKQFSIYSNKPTFNENI